MVDREAALNTTTKEKHMRFAGLTYLFIALAICLATSAGRTPFKRTIWFALPLAPILLVMFWAGCRQTRRQFDAGRRYA